MHTITPIIHPYPTIILLQKPRERERERREEWCQWWRGRKRGMGRWWVTVNRLAG
jgi:hypothetical protein